MSELDANIVIDGQKAVATVPQTGTVIQDGGAIDATCVIQTDNGPQKAVKTYDLNGGGGGGGDVPQNTNPLERITCEEDNVTYATITIDEKEIELEAPFFDSLSEAPTTPLHFIGVLPSEYADSGTTWEYEIVQYKANEAWYHLIGTDMVFCIQRDAEIEDILMVDIVYPLEAMLPDFHQGSSGNKQLIQRDNSDGAIKWVTDNKLENTATGTDSLSILGPATPAANTVVIGKNITANYSSIGVAVGNSSSIGNSVGCTAIGYSAQCASDNTIAVGRGATALSSGTIAIGFNARASSSNAVQLGDGTNSSSNTFQVYSYTMLDKTTGKIPMARLPIVQISQADYDALVSGGTVDANTLYLIV